MEQTQHFVRAQPKILYPSATKNICGADRHENVYLEERPMLLTAWTQTTSEDFALLNAPVNPVITSVSTADTNKELLDKIHFLEESLRKHSEMITQIHLKRPSPINDRNLRSTITQYNHDLDANVPATPVQVSHQILTPPNSVINAIQPLTAHTYTESVKYKIIAESNCDGSVEPIEIKLTNDSLNISADPQPLEVCLDMVEQSLEKTKIIDVSTPIPKPLIKRRKIEPLGVNNTQSIADVVESNDMPSTKQVNINGKCNLPKAHNAQQKDSVMVSIGPNDTKVPVSVFDTINWKSSSMATRKLLTAVFDRETLATHTMTGKPSPAFKGQGKPTKQKLDPLKVSDIIFAVTNKSGVNEKEVRSAITTKCADENKMNKMCQNKRLQKGKNTMQNCDKENMKHNQTM